MVQSFYAYQASKFFFYDPDLVKSVTMPDLTSQTYQSIYYNERFGMNSTRSLLAWVFAADGPDWVDTSLPVESQSFQAQLQYLLLKEFGSFGLTEEYLNATVGPGSMLSMIMANIRTTIYRNSTFGFCVNTTDAEYPVDLTKNCTFELIDFNDHLDTLV